MDLKKGIEILELNVKVAGKKMPPDTLKALNLGVEAMKRVNRVRTDGDFVGPGSLPGETVD